jgi:hypothetical protein
LSGRWLLVRGQGDRPLPQTGFTLERHSSTRRPTITSIPAEEVGIFPSSIWRHSYIRLSAEQFDAARSGVERACRRPRPDRL